MVYHSTKSNFNEVVYASFFPIITSTSHFRQVEECTYIRDCDIWGRVNFILNPIILPFVVIKFTCLFTNKTCNY